MSRNGVRVGDILHNFEEVYGEAKARHEQILKSLNYEYNITELEKQWLEGIEYLKQFHLVDSEHEINNLLKSGKSVLCEGAQERCLMLISVLILLSLLQIPFVPVLVPV